jgi:hypothetical protein
MTAATRACGPVQPAGIFAFISKKASKAQINDVLAIANFTAAPYGTKEFMLTNYGVEGTHYTLKDGLPVKTDKGNNEVNGAFVHGDAAPFRRPPRLPGGRQGQVEWQQRMGAFTKKSSFYGLQVTEPARWTNLARRLRAVGGRRRTRPQEDQRRAAGRLRLEAARAATSCATGTRSCSTTTAPREG